MSISLRTTASDLTAEDYFKLVEFPHQARTILNYERGAIFLLSLFLFFSVTQVSAQHYQQTNLVSDVPGLAQFTDPDLVNPWGLTFLGSSPWWVADNGTGLSTLYNGA